MASNSSRQHPTALLPDDEHGLLRSPTCPLCHASAPLAERATEARDHWRCGRCGQHWDAGRLATVAAYAAWTVERDRVGRPGTDGSQDAALYSDSLAERLGGRP